MIFDIIQYTIIDKQAFPFAGEVSIFEERNNTTTQTMEKQDRARNACLP